MSIFIEIGLIVLVATFISIIMRLLKQPLIVGYILSGVIMGPYFLNLIKSTDSIEIFSKLGIAILLFIIGLSLKPDIIREVGKISLITGIGQIILTTLAGFFLMKFLGFSATTSFFGAMALTFSSTIIILKLISDKGDLDKLYGKISIGFLLVQDVFATLVLLVLAIMSSSTLAEGNVFMAVLFLSLKGFAFFVALYFLSRYVLPKLLNFLATSQELLFLFSISWGIGLAAIFYIFGFSLEIGALAAGVALASSSFSQEIASRMKPLRDFFILLFFVLLGSQMIFSDVKNVIIPVIILCVFVLILKPIIVTAIMNILGYKNRTGFLAGLTVAQVSEFSLILIALGLSLGYLSREVVSLITLVSIISIIGSTYLFLHAEKIYFKLSPILNSIRLSKKINYEKLEKVESLDLVIFGYDRVGYDFVNIADKMQCHYFVVDFNPSAMKNLKKNNIPHFFGDAEDITFLEDIGLAKSRAVISTIPDFHTNLKLVSFYRNHNKNGIIIAISHNIKEAQDLYKSGASFVVMPHYLGAKHASEMIKNYGFESVHFERERRQHLLDLEKRQKITEER